MKKCLFLFFIVLFLNNCFYDKQLLSIENRLKKIEIQIDSNHKNTVVEIQNVKSDIAKLENEIKIIQNADLNNNTQLANLLDELGKLQGKLEENMYKYERLTEQLSAVKEGVVDIAQGVNNFNTPKENANSEEVLDPTKVQPEKIYKDSYSDYVKGNFDLAISGFKTYVKSFPTSELSDNAQYWIGECYYSQGKHEEALKNFKIVTDNYPNSDKVPDSILKISYSYLALKENNKAIEELQGLVLKYPDTKPAQLAKEKLKSIMQ